MIQLLTIDLLLLSICLFIIILYIIFVAVRYGKNFSSRYWEMSDNKTWGIVPVAHGFAIVFIVLPLIILFIIKGYSTINSLVTSILS